MLLRIPLPGPRVALTVFGTVLLFQCLDLSAQTRVLDRYTLLAATPTPAQQDLLGGMSHITLPAEAITVGDALVVALSPSGYRLAVAPVPDGSREILMQLPVPEAHRSLGPMPLRLALQTLVGPAWRLLEDPVHRLVAFERCSAFAEAAPSWSM